MRSYVIKLAENVFVCAIRLVVKHMKGRSIVNSIHMTPRVFWKRKKKLSKWEWVLLLALIGRTINSDLKFCMGAKADITSFTR